MDIFIRVASEGIVIRNYETYPRHYLLLVGLAPPHLHRSYYITRVTTRSY